MTEPGQKEKAGFCVCGGKAGTGDKKMLAKEKIMAKMPAFLPMELEPISFLQKKEAL